MTDHLLEAARDRLGGLHDHLSRREVALAADDLHAILSAILDHLQPETAPDPLDEANHADRYDRDGDLWVWRDECDGFRMVSHKGPSYGWTAAEIDERYGPLTFAPRPAEPPTTAPQPDKAHGDADEPARPELNVQIESWTAIYDGGEIVSSAGFSAWLAAHDAELRADAWGEGHRAGYADGVQFDDDHITLNPYRKDRA